MQRVFSALKKLVLLIVLLTLNGCGAVGLFRKDEPVNYRHLGATLDVIRETAAKENFKRLAILDFADHEGRPSCYSKSFNKELRQKIARLRDTSVVVVSHKNFKALLARLEIKDIGFLTSAEVKRIHEQMPLLDGIVTGNVTLKDGPALFFFRANGDIVQWQKGISEMTTRFVAQIKARALQPLAVSTFYAVSDGKPNSFGKYMTEKIRTELGQQGVEAISPEDYPKITEQWALQQAGITDQSTAVEVGKLTNAKSMLIGSVAGNLSSSWEVNVKLVNVETGVTVWADSYLNLNRSMLQVYLPFELSLADTALLQEREKLLIHHVISDENLTPSARNYYITTIVVLAQIRRSVEIDADLQYAARLVTRLTQFRAELEQQLRQEITKLREEEEQRLAKIRELEKSKLESERQAEMARLAKLREEQARTLAELRRLEEERMRNEREATLKRLLALRSLLGPANYSAELAAILDQLRKVLPELEKYVGEELSVKETSND